MRLVSYDTPSTKDREEADMSSKRDFDPSAWVEAVDAVCAGNMGAFRKVIAKYPELLEGDHSIQLLLSAASNGQLEVMQLLVDQHRMDINGCLGERGTPLHCAAAGASPGWRACHCRSCYGAVPRRRPLADRTAKQ
jgi:hypothetical protein